jgi:hypothetical protein
MALPDMLAYTISSTIDETYPFPTIGIGPRPNNAFLTPSAPQKNSYWFCVVDAQNPLTVVKDFVLPGASNTTVPAGLQQFMENTAYIVTLATQSLNVISLPQGPLYTFLVSHGAGRELQRLEQLNVTLGSGQNTNVSYVLSTQGGKFGYEQGSDRHPVRYAMSLKGGPPYSLCDAYTFQSS